MGPFSNNSPQPSPPPSNGTRLPTPDVEGAPQNIFAAPEPDREGLKKWLTVTLIIAGVMAVAGIVVFALYVYVSNTPSYMLGAAFQNLVASEGEAGTIAYQSNQSVHGTTNGDFLAYTDPTNPHVSSLTINLGQDASRVSTTARLFPDSNYTQAAGLGNIGQLVQDMGGNASALTPDNLVRLSSLDGQWYSLTADDIQEVSTILPQHIVQAGPTSADFEQLEQLYLQHPFFTPAQQFNDERIDGIASMHIKVAIDSAKLSDFLQSVKATNIKSLRLTDTDIQTILHSPLLSGTTMEVWIARSDRTFEQIRLAHGDQTLTLTFKSEEAAAQRQTILRPNNAQSAAGPLRQTHDILTAKPATK